MPEISRFFGIRITMFYMDHDPPHFHARYQNFKASYDIKTGKRIAGTFPKNGERIIQSWAEINKGPLLKNWELMKTKGIFKKIKGADR